MASNKSVIIDNMNNIHNTINTTDIINNTDSNNNIKSIQNINTTNNHFFELLRRMYIQNINRNKLSASSSDSNIKKSYDIKNVDIHSLMNYFKKEIATKTYLDTKSPLSNLVINDIDNFLIVSTNEINENLRHINPQLDRVLHQMKYVIFEKPSFAPICYVEKTIKESDLTYTNPNNSYLRSHVYNVIEDYTTKEFDKQIVLVYKHYIGSYMVLFFCKDRWNFVLHNNVYEFNCGTHPILYEHIGDHISKFDKNMCYHIVLVDTRIRRLITPTTDINYVILIKITEKYTLIPNNKYTYYVMDLIHDVLVNDRRIYFSCLDELYVKLEELDITNSKSMRLLNRGYIVQIKTDEFDLLNIAYDTLTYKRLMSMIPAGMSIHEVHLKLYQIDKLNFFLQYITDTYTDVVKRINISMSTLSREILDIYHMTRKKKNSDLYNILPQSYRQVLYQLHSDYISQKNQNTLSSSTSSLSTLSLSTSIPKCKILNNVDNDDDIDIDSMDSNDDKVSISVDNVYTKIKTLELYSLVELYKDREELIKKLEDNVSTNIPINPIKSCTNTKIQSKLLSIKSPI